MAVHPLDRRQGQRAAAACWRAVGRADNRVRVWPWPDAWLLARTHAVGLRPCERRPDGIRPAVSAVRADVGGKAARHAVNQEHSGSDSLEEK